MHRLTKSYIGRAFSAIREDETAAAAMGVNLAYYKVLAFAFGTFWAGIAGSMLAHFLLFVGPMTFSIDESILHMQMVILGGLGSLPGSILGAAILVSLPQIFQSIYPYRMLLSGVLMVGLMIWRPQGILGVSAAGVTRGRLQQWFARLSGKSSAVEAVDAPVNTGVASDETVES
jgi:branched-chain amino acid transport system permease protein